MKVAIYNTLQGSTMEVEYDENQPCRVCGKPVIEASMGGTSICPWCDCGAQRNDVDCVPVEGSVIKMKTELISLMKPKPISFPKLCPLCDAPIYIKIYLDSRIKLFCKKCGLENIIPMEKI